MLFTSKLTLYFAVVLSFSGTVLVHGQDADADTDGGDGADVASTTATSAAGASSIDPCLQTCVQQAAMEAGCSDITDIDCMCSSVTFQSDTETCLQDQCPSSVASQAQALQSQQCSAVSGDGQSPSATGDSARNLASSSAGTRTSTGGSARHSSTSAVSAAISSASSSSSSLATAGSDKTVNMNKIIGFGAITVGLIYGALAVW